MKKIVRIVVVLAVVAAMVLGVARRKAAMKKMKPYGMRPLAVRVVPARRETLERAHDYLGVVEPWQVASVSSRISARVEKVFYYEGDRVKKGDLLVQLDDSDIRAQLDAMESTIQSLETNKQFWVEENARDSKLAKEGVIPPVQAQTTRNRLADAVAKLQNLRNQRDALKTKLAYTKLTSPFDGVVSRRDVDPGDLAAPGRPLMVVEDRSAFKIAFDAPQEDVAFLKKGLPVRGELGGQEVEWEITRIYPSLDKRRMVRVEAKSDPVPGLRSGAFVPLRVVLGQEKDAVVVPRECLMNKGTGDWMVFVVDGGRLHLRKVHKLAQSNGLVAVLGVEPGEQVLASTFLGWANLADGQKVEVVK